MELGNTILTLGIIIVLVAAIAIVFVLQLHLESKFGLKEKITGRSGKKPTYFVDEGEDEKKCDICYGKIEEDTIAECSCGRIFHHACAKPTGACPYCGAECDTMTVREPVRTRCPVCGRFVKGGVCTCGVILPTKDETFLCKCGNRVDMKKPVCRKCGAVYESVTMQIYKKQK
jgi:hypothetical protein